MRLTFERVLIRLQDFTLGPISSEAVGPALLAVVGPSGAGKSTLLRLAAGLANSDDGEIRHDNQPIPDSDAQRARFRLANSAYASQKPLFFDDLTIRRNLAYASRLRKAEPAQIDKYLEATGIAHVSERMPGTLSGGELARANVARALIGICPIVLVDEPTATLDKATASRISRMLILESRTRLVVAATHDEEIIGAAGFVWTMECGRMTVNQ